MTWTLCLSIALTFIASIIGVYLVKKYIYGHSPKEWKPILFSKDDSWYSLFKDVITGKKNSKDFS